jgi:hypothetical protein
MTPSSSNPTVDHQAAAGDDRVGGNNKKSSNKHPEGAAVKEPPRRQNRSGDKHKKNRSSNSKNENPKRRRRHNPRSRSTDNIISEPHVVQEPLNCISDHDKRGCSTTKATCVLRAAAIARRLQAEEEERLLQESIERHTTLLTPERNPEFFVRVYHKNRGEEWLE